MVWPEPPQYYEAPKVGYKVILQQPSFPVIFPDPTIAQVVGNLRPSAMGLAAGMALAGAGLGYWRGSVAHWQKPGMVFGALLLGKTGLMWGLVDSSYRLMGYKSNDVEVARNLPGLIKPEAY